MAQWDMRYVSLLPFIVTAGMAQAGCPDAPDHSEALDGLIAQAQAAQDEMTGRELSNAMWGYWADAPDMAAQELLDEGMSARRAYDFVGALRRFDKLIAYCPDYAEGYNQRAFVHFLSQNFDAALPDLDKALEINPRHVGVLAGKALTLMGLGRDEEAQIVLRKALALNPWLSERSLLKEPAGEDI